MNGMQPDEKELSELTTGSESKVNKISLSNRPEPTQMAQISLCANRKMMTIKKPSLTNEYILLRNSQIII